VISCAAVKASSNLFQGLFDAGINMIELHTGEVEQFGETATELSTATLRGADDQVIDHAKYIIIWKRRGGEWQIHRDIFNLNGPAK
jgi:ketosteroid isomerase-like protein